MRSYIAVGLLQHYYVKEVSKLEKAEEASSEIYRIRYIQPFKRHVR